MLHISGTWQDLFKNLDWNTNDQNNQGNIEKEQRWNYTIGYQNLL